MLRFTLSLPWCFSDFVSASISLRGPILYLTLDRSACFPRFYILLSIVLCALTIYFSLDLRMWFRTLFQSQSFCEFVQISVLVSTFLLFHILRSGDCL